MVIAEFMLSDIERPLKKRVSPGVIALLLANEGKIVKPGGDAGMVRSQSCLRYLKRLSAILTERL